MPKITDELEQFASAYWQRDKPGPVWSWWLAGAKADGLGLRRWQFWIWWTRQRRVQTRLAAAIRFFRGFIEAPQEAWGGLQSCGEKTETVHGISRTTQFRQLLMLRWRFGIRPESYYKFQLFKPDLMPAAPDFIEDAIELLQVIHRHSPRKEDERLFVNKEEFQRWCLANEIPTVENLLKVNNGKVVSRLAEQLPAASLFVKPTNWNRGKGASLWRCMRSKHGHHYTDGSGRELNTADFENFVCRTSLENGRPYIVQPVLENHQSLRKYTNGALATVRLMTLRGGSGQSAQPLMAALKMPTGDAIVDHFTHGGVAAPIDLKTGVCGPGLQNKGQLPPDTVNAHPDTGSVISGLTIPCWSECIALTCRAHDLINAQVPVIGWDVAILDHGPVLIEPNYLPGHEIAQMPGAFPLGASPFATTVTARLRACFLTHTT